MRHCAAAARQTYISNNFIDFSKRRKTGFASGRRDGDILDVSRNPGMRSFWQAACTVIFAGSLFAALYAQRPFREYPSVEYGESIPLPPDWQRPGEWTFARLMYPPGPLDGYRGRFDGDWRLGLSLWTQDYPRADRAFSQAVRRLTRIDARSGLGSMPCRWANGA